MNPRLAQRWSELAPLLDAALESPPGPARDAVLAAVQDPELRELLHALAAQDGDDGFLDAPSTRYAEALLVAPAAPAAIGPYTVRRLLGEGGSGSVFLAERELDGAHQQVALKLLRSGLYDAAEQARFRRERRILARLVHPHIARLLDGGFTEAGVPWFALEYVDGAPITQWCDARRLDLDARLRLFETVCAAVDHAHRALIVHRDLKPANLLVDAVGAPKLLDFGIAKLLDAQDEVSHTHTALRRLTPAYAAPEQIAGGPITTATDVYALGVLLHELLAGCRPVPGDAAVPASRAYALQPSRAAIAEARATTPAALARRLRGDLDLVLSTALAAEPTARYPTAAALAADLVRQRTQRPLHARRAGVAERLRKFVARHRLGVAAGALLALSVVAGSIATWREAEHARRAAAAARLEAARARAVQQFVLALFHGVTPDEAKGRAVGARELLERGEARLAETLATQPALQAELATDLAASWRQLGDYPRAERLLQSALDAAPSPAERASAQLELGRVLTAQGRYDAAETALRDAAAQAEGDTRLQARLQLADLLGERGQIDAGRREATAVLQEIATQVRPPALALAQAQASVGALAFRAGDLVAAAAALDQAVALRRGALGERHTETAQAEHDLGVVLLQQGQVDAAIASLRQALATRSALLGPRHPDLAETQFNLGTALRRAGQRDEAVRLIASAVAMQRELLGPTHPAVANGLNSLALIAYEQGDLATALQRMDEALTAARAAYGPRHATVATLLGNYAGMQRSAGRYEAAVSSAREAVAAADAAVGAQHYLAGVMRLGLGGALVDAGRVQEALPWLDAAQSILAQALGPRHQDTLQAQAARAEALRLAGRPEAALPLAEASLKDGEQAFPPGHPKLGRLRLIAARLLAQSGACARALPMLALAEEELVRGGAALRADLAAAQVERGLCLVQSDRAAAQQALRQALAGIEAGTAVPPRPLRRVEALRAALRR